MTSQPLKTRMQERQFTMRKHTSFFLFLILAVSFLSAFSKAALADDDPPGRVARLNYMQGSVSFQPGGESDWVQANPNRPLTTGDNLWTDRNSRGELHIGSTAVRLSSETGISFLNLDDRTVQIQLAQGSLSVHIRRLDGGDAFEVDTPNLAFSVERPGEYRFDVDPNGQTTNLTVREGEGEATGGGSNFHMDSGENANVSGTDSLTFDVGRAEGPDGFDDWSRSRDAREEHARSAQYVSRDVIGYEDLDEYGEWRSVPDYGSVWFPRHVATGWAPYRFGHWVWIAPWGWTWVEDEPWGFAPFHYGRCAEVGGGWCWVPGPVVVRPVYAPALVVFVGGPRFGLSLSFGGGGGVAWFPLGPRGVAVAPVRQSIIGPGVAATVRPPEAAMNRQVVVKQTPAASPLSFQRRQQVLSSEPGRAPTQQQMEQLRSQQGQQQPNGKFSSPAQTNDNKSQPGRGAMQQQSNQGRGAQGQQQPAGKFIPPAQTNDNRSQPGRGVMEQQGDQGRAAQGQQQPAGKFI